MKKIKCFLRTALIIILLMILSYLIYNTARKSDEASSIPTGMSAKETVELYFKFWDDKNAAGCDNLWVESEEHTKFGLLDMMYRIKLTNCYEFSREDTISSYSDQIEYGNYYDYTYIFVHFDLANTRGSNMEGCWGDGDTVFGYFLVKETKDSDWRIKSEGLC